MTSRGWFFSDFLLLRPLFKHFIFLNLDESCLNLWYLLSLQWSRSPLSLIFYYFCSMILYFTHSFFTFLVSINTSINMLVLLSDYHPYILLPPPSQNKLFWVFTNYQAKHQKDWLVPLPPTKMEVPMGDQI